MPRRLTPDERVEQARALGILYDPEDEHFIREYTWRIAAVGYAFNSTNQIYLHRLIMDADDDEQVDHRNHNKIDNRRANLRIVTKSQNMSNLVKHANGVDTCIAENQGYGWYVRFSRDGALYTSRTFKSIEEARAWRDAHPLYRNT